MRSPLVVPDCLAKRATCTILHNLAAIPKRRSCLSVRAIVLDAEPRCS